MLNVEWIPAFAGMTTVLSATFKDCRHNDNSAKCDVLITNTRNDSKIIFNLLSVINMPSLIISPPLRDNLDGIYLFRLF
ncbi:hypothetical protein AGMMS49936_08420 [Endomicrobiia bacterium]|nr:hypothetical protein AGMMS49936_08420 [Endomicrobiia bacterium]